MKHLRLNTTELECLRWKVWEPLRRNVAYRNEFIDLNECYLRSDFEAIDRFCERWRLPWPISPTIEFNELSKAPWLADFFSFYFIPYGDPAAFVPCSNFIVDGSLLRIFVNPDYSRNQIEAELRKIFSQWLKTREFYGIKRTKKTSSEAFRHVRKVGGHIEVRLDLSATRRAIVAGAAMVLGRISKGRRKKKNPPRLQPDKWRKAFEAFDLAGKTPSSIALALQKKPNTLVRMLQRAALAINALDPNPATPEEIKRRLKQMRKPYSNPVSFSMKCKRCGKDSATRYCADCMPELKRWLKATETKLHRLERTEMECVPYIFSLIYR